jgi:molybdopterin molybdotransferase
MVTFEIFARAALELLAGQEETALHMPLARLTCEFRHRAGLTRFLPARLSATARGDARRSGTVRAIFRR